MNSQQPQQKQPSPPQTTQRPPAPAPTIKAPTTTTTTTPPAAPIKPRRPQLLQQQSAPTIALPPAPISPLGGESSYQVHVRPLSDFKPVDFVLAPSPLDKDDVDKNNLSFQYKEVIAFKSLLSLRGADDGESDDERPSQLSLGRLSYNSYSSSSASYGTGSVVTPGLASIRDNHDDNNNNNNNVSNPSTSNSPIGQNRRPLQRTTRNPKGLKAIIDEANQQQQQEDGVGRLSFEILDIPNFFKVMQGGSSSSDTIINRQHRITSTGSDGRSFGLTESIASTAISPGSAGGASKSTSFFNSVLTTSSHHSDSAEDEHIVLAALNGHGHFTSPGNYTMSSTDYDGSIASISRISGIFSSTSSDDDSDTDVRSPQQQQQQQHVQDEGNRFGSSRRGFSKKTHREGGFYSQKITLPDIPDDQLHDDADHSSDGEDLRKHIQPQQQLPLPPPQIQQQLSPRRAGSPFKSSISSPPITTLSLNTPLTPLAEHGHQSQHQSTASPKAITPPMMVVAGNARAVPKSPLSQQTAASGNAVIHTSTILSYLPESTATIEQSLLPVESTVLNSIVMTSAAAAAAAQNSGPNSQLRTGVINNSNPVMASSLSLTNAAASRAVSRKDFDRNQRQVIFPIPPMPEDEAVKASSNGSDKAAPQQQHLQLLFEALQDYPTSPPLRSILKPPRAFSTRPFIPGVSTPLPPGLGSGTKGRNSASTLSTLSQTPLGGSPGIQPRVKTVTFIKPTEELLQLRIRFYTAQKEEQNHIIVNPQKRPKRQKRGFFASVKSLFSGTPKGSGNSSVFTPDGTGNGPNGATSGRRGSITKDSPPSNLIMSATPSPSSSSSSSSNNLPFQPVVVASGSSTPGTGPLGSASPFSTGSNGPASAGASSRATNTPSGLTPLNLSGISNEAIPYQRRGSVISQPSPTHSAHGGDADDMSEDDPSDSDYDNREPECIANTRTNTPGPKVDICDRLLQWEMYYTGFKEFVPRDSANFVSFHGES